MKIYTETKLLNLDSVKRATFRGNIVTDWIMVATATIDIIYAIYATIAIITVITTDTTDATDATDTADTTTTAVRARQISKVSQTIGRGQTFGFRGIISIL